MRAEREVSLTPVPGCKRLPSAAELAAAVSEAGPQPFPAPALAASHEPNRFHSDPGALAAAKPELAGTDV